MENYTYRKLDLSDIEFEIHIEKNLDEIIEEIELEISPIRDEDFQLTECLKHCLSTKISINSGNFTGKLNVFFDFLQA